jgi:hypothetical protein
LNTNQDDTYPIKEKTMEENTKTEKFLDVDEEQLQAITGAGGSGSSTPTNNKEVLNLYKEHVDHLIQGTISHALGNTIESAQHNDQANAAMDKLKPFYESQEAKSPVASPKKGCLGCFSFK